MSESRWRWAYRATWALPAYGALTLVATMSQQPDPKTRFEAWSEYVTTDWFYASHIGASILGLALGTLGVVGLGVVLGGGRRPRAALGAIGLHVLGAAVLFALFGVAAFVQPAIGDAFLGGDAAARDWYDAVFDGPRTLVPAVLGLLLFSAGSILMAWSLAEWPRVPRWVAWGYGMTAPFIGILGLMISVLQTVGSALLMGFGGLIAARLNAEVGTPRGACHVAHRGTCTDNDESVDRPRPLGGTMSDVRSTPHQDERLEGSTRVEHEQVGLHNEAQTIRRDRIRWGPIWAGIVTAVGTYIILQLALVAVGAVELGDASTSDAIWSGVAALVAFFIGGLTVGATSMWQGVDDGAIHGVVMWFAALVLLIVLGTFGSGVALGAIDVSDAFEEFTSEGIDADEANDTAREASRNALIGIVLALVAAGAGGAVGSKIWPKDDIVVDVRTVRRDT